MTKAKYGIIEPETKFPIRKLLVVPHKDRDLIVSYPAFGPNYFKQNIAEMQKTYSHPKTGKQITFEPTTTSESILAAAYDFQYLAKPQIFNPNWLQAGYIVRTKDGVFTNTNITDESKLKKLLNKSKKVNGIYLINDKIAFAPYDSFKQGFQDCDTFSSGGLARVLEHTNNKFAKNLKEIASPKFYKNGVKVLGFDEVKEPSLRVASLNSVRDLVDSGLRVYGNDWDDYYGCAFGVLNKSRSDASKK